MRSQPKPKPVTPAGFPDPLFTELVSLLEEAQREHFHRPNADFMEYCNGCGTNPNRSPQHTPECLVPRIEQALGRVGELLSTA